MGDGKKPEATGHCRGTREQRGGKRRKLISQLDSVLSEWAERGSKGCQPGLGVGSTTDHRHLQFCTSIAAITPSRSKPVGLLGPRYVCRKAATANASESTCRHTAGARVNKPSRISTDHPARLNLVALLARKSDKLRREVQALAGERPIRTLERCRRTRLYSLPSWTNRGFSRRQSGTCCQRLRASGRFTTATVIRTERLTSYISISSTLTNRSLTRPCVPKP